MGSYFSGLLRYFRKEDPRTPVKGALPRIKNIIINHFRGILGVIPIILFAANHNKKKAYIQVLWAWIWMVWWFFFQPVNVPVTGLLPVYIFPMNGILSTSDVCDCYFNIIVALLILASMIHLLLNNSGLDRRIILTILCCGEDANFSPSCLIFKCSTAAYFLSIFSNRLIVTSYITEIMTPILQDFESSTAKQKNKEPAYDKMRYIVSSAILVSSTLGGMVLIHGAFATMTFLTTWSECAPAGMVYEDIFNYLQFSCFTFPVTLTIFIVVMIYHILLIKSSKMSALAMGQMRNKLMAHKNGLPKSNAHEKLTLLFLILALAFFFFRWSKWFNFMGWVNFQKHEGFPNVPYVYDATVAAMFVIIVHILPKGISFVRIFTAKYKSELSNLKPESGILWWRFVDKNINYGYMYVLGSGLALNTAAVSSGLSDKIAENIGSKLTHNDYKGGIFMVCLIATLLSNIMSGAAACVSFLPLVLNIPNVGGEWEKKKYLGALGVGLGSSFGYMCPFLYTPAYYCLTVAKTPRGVMAKYGLFPAVISLFILWGYLVLYAPVIFGSVEYVTAPAKPGAVAVSVEPAPEAPGDLLF